MQTVKLPRSKNKLEEQFPQEAEVITEGARQMNEDNHFRNHDVSIIRKKYLQFTVYMEALNEVLELPREATVEQFSRRIHDIVLATNKEE